MMQRLNLHMVTWQLRQLHQLLGLCGWLGLALFIGSLLLYQSKVRTFTVETNAINAEVALKKNQTLSEPLITPIATASVTDVEAFYLSFPRNTDLPALLTQINRLALAQQLVINSGDYRFKKSTQAASAGQQQLSRYELAYPVVGRYPQLRQFVQTMHAEMPALVLEDIEISRENTLSPLVESRMLLVIFVRDSRS